MAMNSRSSGSAIFDDSSSGDDDEAQRQSPSPSGLTFNKSYADNYNNWRGKEELQKLKARYGSPDPENSESESSSSEDSDWTPETEKEFLKTLSSLKAKNPKIYDQNALFFTSKGQEKDDKKPSTSSKKSKPFLLKDHERQMILENDGIEPEIGISSSSSTSKKSYWEELKDIKNEFSSALENVHSDSENENGNQNSDLLKKRSKSSKETSDEEEAYRKWLKGELQKLDGDKKSKKDAEELKYLHDYWTDPQLEDGETFLRDYILNRKYIDKDPVPEKIPSYEEIVHDSDEGGLSGDERRLEQMEAFETKYNFRFEEPDQEFIKKYPRTIEETYRRKDTKRQSEREKIKERKKAEKERKLAEINQLKALKRKEIMNKLNKLSEITGTKDLPFDDKDLEGDFDPEEYDKRMSQVFSENYYDDGDEEKPVFPYDENVDGNEVEDIDFWVPSDDESSDSGETTGKVDKKKSSKNKKKLLDDSLNHGEEKYSNLPSKSSTFQSELIELSKGRRGKASKKKSLFLQKLERKKPKFDPSAHESYQKYFDEYYKLDFEDLIGDIPCRFKYRNVVPNDFGLKTEEILAAPDTELNQWASLKKTFTYRPVEEEKFEVQAYAKRAGDVKAKKKKIPSLYASPKHEEDEEEADNEVDVSTIAKKKKKKKRKKKNKSNTTLLDIESKTDDQVEQSPTTGTDETLSKKKKKKKTSTEKSNQDHPLEPEDPTKKSNKNHKRKQTDTTTGNLTLKKAKTNHHNNPKAKTPVDEDRLRAYGINPTKYIKRRKYGA